MLNALSLSDALAIAAAAQRVSDDERAMVAYLNLGRKRAAPPADGRVVIADADAGAFDSPERRNLEEMVAWLTPEARQELIALIWLARAVVPDVAQAIRRARRVPVSAQTGYILGTPLENRIPAALEKLGLRG